MCAFAPGRKPLEQGEQRNPTNEEPIERTKCQGSLRDRLIFALNLLVFSLQTNPRLLLRIDGVLQTLDLGLRTDVSLLRCENCENA